MMKGNSLLMILNCFGEDSEQSENEDNDEENEIDVCGIIVVGWIVEEYDRKSTLEKV